MLQAKTINQDSQTQPHRYSGKAREIAAVRAEALEAFRKAKSVSEKQAVVEIWNATHPESTFSRRSLYRLDRDERNGGDLMPKWGRTAQTTVPDELFHYFKSMYLTQQKRPATVCWDLLKMQYSGIPSVHCFMRRLERELPKNVIYYYREGDEAYNRKYAPYITRDYSTVAPGQIYVMDHHQIDVAVMGRDGKPLFPWATVCADVRSRKYLGWAICVQPNSDSIHLAFRRAGIRFGIPQEVDIDNGKDFRHMTFTGGNKRFRLKIDEMATKSLLSVLKVAPHFALPYNAQSKPVERSFLTIKERFSRLLPAFRGGDVTERPEELQAVIESGKLLPMEEFEKLYSGFVEAVFNTRPHRGQGMDKRAPNEVWAEGNVARQADEDLLSLLLMKSSRPIKVGRNGVSFLDRIFEAEQLLHLKGDYVYLRYDPGEMARVWVYNMKDEFVCQAKERALLPYRATEDDLKAAIRKKHQDKRVIRSYHEIQHDRAKEPDLVKFMIMKNAQKPGVDLREAAMMPEKPLLHAHRITENEKERMREEEDARRRALVREFLETEVPEPKKESYFDEDMQRFLGLDDFGTKRPQGSEEEGFGNEHCFDSVVAKGVREGKLKAENARLGKEIFCKDS